MYHKSRRKQRRFYPEFYDDDDIKVTNDINLKLEPEPDENMREISAVQEAPINYNDLLYPSRIKMNSVFKQLENMQKDYIKKKLEVSRTNNISINPDVTGSDKIINRNEAAAINENNNEIRIEIPDSMYTGEVQDLHNNKAEENINEVAESVSDVNDTNYMDDRNDNGILYEMNHSDVEDDLNEQPEVDEDLKVMLQAGNAAEDIEDLSEETENPGEAVETFEHIQLPETYKFTERAGESVLKPEQSEQREPPLLNFEQKTEDLSVKEPIVERDYSAHNSETSEISEISEIPKIPEHKTKLIPFDKVKAIEYAHRWALDRNPNFLDFDELGGDCTNYISQILLAGGCKMDHTPVYGWYYSSGSEKSPSWTGVEQLYNYLIKEKKYGIIAKEISAEEAEAGDIVQLSFNGRTFQHTPFIVEVSKNADTQFHFDSIKICAHSFDSQNRALDTYQWRKIRFIRILGYMEK